MPFTITVPALLLVNLYLLHVLYSTTFVICMLLPVFGFIYASLHIVVCIIFYLFYDRWKNYYFTSIDIFNFSFPSSDRIVSVEYTYFLSSSVPFVAYNGVTS